MAKKSTHRIIVSLPRETAEKLRRLARLESRSLSNCAGVIVGRAMASDPETINAASELRALGADPLMALRDKIAEVQRDQFLSPNHDERTTPNLPAPSPVSQPHLSHPPAPSRRLASRAASRPALRVG